MSAIPSVTFVVRTSAFIGASLVFRFHFYADATELAANVIKSATSLGCETIAAWLDATLRTSAPMRLAMNSSACGGIIWSILVIAASCPIVDVRHDQLAS